MSHKPIARTAADEGSSSPVQPKSADTRPPRNRIRSAVAAVVLLVAGMAAYANGFTGHFAGLDARESIRDNPHIRHVWPLSEAMSLPLLSSTKAADEGSKGGTVVRRPFLSLSFALNHSLTGMHANGFHAVNIAIHLCAGLLMFGIVRRGFARAAPAEVRRAADGIALATALLWMLHPLQTESVTYIVQRAESLMGLFFLTAIYAGVRAFDSPRPARWYAASVAAAALGMGTKEVAAVAPVLILLYDAMFVSRGPRDALRTRRGFYAALFSTWMLLAALMLMTLDDVGSDFTEGRNLAYALAQPAVILHYLRVALWPHPLQVYINTTLYDDLGWLRIAISALAIAALLGASAWGVIRRKWYGFVGAWFFLILAPSSSIVAVSDVVQEHRMYLSLAAVMFVVVIAVFAALRRLAPSRAAGAGAVLLASVVVAFGALTHLRNRAYHSEFSMIHPADLHEAYLILGNHYTLGNGDREVGRQEAEAALAQAKAGSPDYTYAHYLLGRLADERGETEAAVQHFELAQESDPTFTHATAKLGESLLAIDDPQRARAALERAIERSPLEPDLYLGLGRTRLALGDAAGARDSFERVVALEPQLASAHNNLGFALEWLGDHKRAEAEYRAALGLDPGMVVAHRNLARMLAKNGDLDGARLEYEAALAGEPTETLAHLGLGEVCDAQQDFECADTHLQEAERLAPDDPQILSTVGTLMEKRDRLEDAERLYRRALAANSNHVGARNALGTLLARQQRFDDAVPEFERVLRADPHNVDAHSNLGAVYASQGRAREAAEHLREVLRLDPERHAANFNLGLLLEGQGKLEQAQVHYERELELDPSFEAARRNLERVRTEIARTAE